MALQNALGGLALDATLSQLITAVQALTTVAQAQQAALDTQQAAQAHDQRMFPPRALQYARDNQDQMRVAVGSMPNTTTVTSWGAANAYPLWYASGGPAAVDARENQRELSQQTFNDVRRARWVIT